MKLDIKWLPEFHWRKFENNRTTNTLLFQIIIDLYAYKICVCMAICMVCIHACCRMHLIVPITKQNCTDHGCCFQFGLIIWVLSQKIDVILTVLHSDTSFYEFIWCRLLTQIKRLTIKMWTKCFSICKMTRIDLEKHSNCNKNIGKLGTLCTC